MSLVTQPWRLVASAVAGGANISDYLTTIQTILASATYASGAARTPGAGNAWSVETAEGAPLEALLLAPPGGSPASGKVLLAGFNGAKTPTMLAPDTWLANVLLCSVSSNGGTLSGWDAAAPLGAVRWSGYYRSSVALGGAAGNVYVFETQEAVAIFVVNGANVSGFIAGAIVDPLSTHALDAEADGRRYGMWVSGPTTISTTLNNTGNAFGSHNASANQVHAALLTVGGATVEAASRMSTTLATTDTDFCVLPSGARAVIPIAVKNVAYTTANGRLLGIMRGVFLGVDARLGQTPTLDGVRYYPVGGSEIADVDCYWLAGE